MTKMQKRIVIYGGAFNPPHIGHAVVIDSIIRLFTCDEIWAMPSSVKRQDKVIGVSDEDRIKMTELLIEELFTDSKIPVKVSDLEIKHTHRGITHETYKELTARFPDDEFHFLVGSDIAGGIIKWDYGEELCKHVNFIIIKRFQDTLPDNMPEKRTILSDDVIEVNLSSTFMRKIIKDGHSGAPYLPKTVAEYIKINKLYR